ncbi:MAG: hypothetical protein WC969_01800 [Elusimicrobiota bacterium]|jgi:hypothetical protein
MFRPLGLALLFFAAPLRAQPREAAMTVPAVPQTPVTGVSLQPNAIPGLVSPNGLSLPTALPTLGVVNTPAAPTVAPKAAAAVLPAAQAARNAASSPKAAAVVLPAATAAKDAPHPAALPQAGEGAPENEGSAEALTQEGLVRFDQGKAVSATAPEAVEPAAPSLWSRAVSWLKKADEAPPFPGAVGRKLRIAGKTYTLSSKVSESSESASYRTLESRDALVTLFAPSAAGVFAQRTRDLEALAPTGLPHARLLAASAATRVLVQETPEEIASFRLGAGPLASQQKNGLADFAAALLLAGRSAELSPRSMLWDHWRTTWRLRDGAGFGPAGPAAVLGQLLEPGFAKAVGLEPAPFLAALRNRLGPDSPAWKGAVSAASALPHLKAAFSALEKTDAALPPAPTLSFGPGRAAPATDPSAAGTARKENDLRAASVFDDSWVSRGELAKRLGFDPFDKKHARFNLHADDPGKLNTSILQVNPLGGGTSRVMKSSSLEIIRNELFVRKVIRRWFGAYLETPRSLAVREGTDATMLMELSEGGRSWTGDGLTLEQRIAFALLAHTFGLHDVNPGNVLFPSKGLPVLIDFEQALGRHRPAQRIPDEGILQELPWVNGSLIPTVEQHGPALRAWRALLAEPGTRAELEKMLFETGWSREEAAARLDAVYDNASRLEWLIQSDVEFARGFERRRNGKPD